MSHLEELERLLLSALEVARELSLRPCCVDNHTSDVLVSESDRVNNETNLTVLLRASHAQIPISMKRSLVATRLEPERVVLT